MSVGIYYKCSNSMNCFHSRSCYVRGVVVLLLFLPIKAMFLLKSLHRIMLLRGLL